MNNTISADKCSPDKTEVSVSSAGSTQKEELTVKEEHGKCLHKSCKRENTTPDADGIDDVVSIDLICTDCGKCLVSDTYCISANWRTIYDQEWGSRNGYEEGPL
mmetsp:Transcript_126295/g.247588  ORF Transcript_126295/g.247588 Transcript_126295/m.247588 type:complete len:104 (-) Transcript_126295:1128-1439(-)